jgi:nuclear receptor subfamily 1 group I
VSDVQDRYLVLLKHYLESRYGYSRAAVMFPELMSKLRELKEFAEIHGRCVVDINPSEIEPIMLEILDLK